MTPTNSDGAEARTLVLVTGASMGLGSEFARQLATRRCDLILVARSEDRLLALSDELEKAHGIKAHVFRCDLSQEGAAARIVSFLEEEGLKPNWLINNAGFGDGHDLDTIPITRLHDCIMVNILALTELTRLLIPALKTRRDARIINVGSTASFQPVPCMTTYAATKAYVLSFTEALSEELRPFGVRVHCLCPGPTATEFGRNANLNPKPFKHSQTAEKVVRMCLRASDAGSVVCITQMRLLIFGQRFLPRWLVRRAAAFVGRKFI